MYAHKSKGYSYTFFSAITLWTLWTEECHCIFNKCNFLLLTFAAVTFNSFLLIDSSNKELKITFFISRIHITKYIVKH